MSGSSYVQDSSLASTPVSPYLGHGAGPSSTSLHTYSSSFSSLVPDTAAYNYEFERLRLEYKRSEENLRLEREHAESQRKLFERDREERERHYQAELATLRRELEKSGRSAGEDKKGKRRQ
jgi:hypothetical protein